MKASELLLASAEPFDKACVLVLQLEAENAELKRQLAEREWQQIETAPIDGNEVLLCNCIDMCIGKGSWSGVYWMWGVFSDPTHWMPLPEAPKQEEKLK